MRLTVLGLALAATPALAEEVTYRKDIHPIWQARCSACHGPASPGLAEFDANKDKYKALSQGPRMDSYAHLAGFVGWPDTGALMRRLDDGRHSQDGRPGNMYERLGDDEAERQKNLALFKAWVGEGGWFLGKPGDLDIETLRRIKAAE